jgi:hypothetical protein
MMSLSIRSNLVSLGFQSFGQAMTVSPGTLRRHISNPGDRLRVVAAFSSGSSQPLTSADPAKSRRFVASKCLETHPFWNTERTHNPVDTMG